jgi:hypothetical protein
MLPTRMIRTALCLSLLAAACGADDPTAPDPSLEVELGGGSVSLRNASDACDRTGWTWGALPSPGEVGWLVSRITPANGGFAVERLHHQLYNLDVCTSRAPYRVRVVRGTGVTPPDDAPILFETMIIPPEVAKGTKLSPIDTALPSAIELGAGESLFVMFEIIRPIDAAVCVKTCRDGVVSLDHDWEGTPGQWQAMSTAKDPTSLDVRVDGHRI